MNPINPVGYVELHTTDPDRARAFYSELFAWSSAEEETPLGPYTAFEGVLAGLTAPRGGVAPGWLPYVDVPDVVEATRRARKLGATIVRECVEIPGGTFSVLRDPTGGQLGLFEKKRT